MTVKAHGLGAYRKGCRCRKCKDACAKYQRDRRARNVNADSGKSSATVIAMPTSSRQVQAATPPAEPGPVEIGVREQVDTADARGDGQAGIKAAAIKLAQLIDDPDAAGQAGQNIAKLQRLLDALGKPKRKTKGGGTLATVSAMAGRRRAQ